MTYKEREANHEAYRKLKGTVAKRYPHGHLVAIHKGLIVADAPSFDTLVNTLRNLGLNPRQSLIVQAGVTYPDKVDIFI